MARHIPDERIAIPASQAGVPRAFIPAAKKGRPFQNQEIPLPGCSLPARKPATLFNRLPSIRAGRIVEPPRSNSKIRLDRALHAEARSINRPFAPGYLAWPARASPYPPAAALFGAAPGNPDDRCFRAPGRGHTSPPEAPPHGTIPRRRFCLGPPPHRDRPPLPADIPPHTKGAFFRTPPATLLPRGRRVHHPPDKPPRGGARRQ